MLCYYSTGSLQLTSYHLHFPDKEIQLKEVNDLPRVTQWADGGVRICTQVCLDPRGSREAESWQRPGGGQEAGLRWWHQCRLPWPEAVSHQVLAIPSPSSASTPFPRSLVQQPGTSLPWSATKVLFNWDLQETEMLYLSSLEPEKPRSYLDLASSCLAQPLGEGRPGLKGPWTVTCEETSALA